MSKEKIPSSNTNIQDLFSCWTNWEGQTVYNKGRNCLKTCIIKDRPYAIIQQISMLKKVDVLWIKNVYLVDSCWLNFYNTLNVSHIKDSNSTGQYLLLYRNSNLVPRTLHSLSENDSWHQKKVLFKLILRKGSKGLIQGLEMSTSPCHFKSKSLYQLNYTFTLTVSFGKYWLSQWSLHLSTEPANQTYSQWEFPSEGDRRSIFALRLNYESWKQKSTNWEL